MNYPIPYLDTFLLILLACFPSGFDMVIPSRVKYPVQTHCMINVVLALVLSFCLKRENLKAGDLRDAGTVLSMAVLVILTGVLCILAEYAMAQFFYYRTHKSLAKGIRIPAYEKCRWYVIFFVLAQSASEEIVLKCSMYYILTALCGLQNELLLIVILAVVFAFNHIFSSKEQILEKLVVGLIIAALFVTHDGIIWYAIVPHMILNASYFVMAERRKVR